MTTTRAFAFTAALARITTLLMFGLLVLGSVVRTTGSGLACPDWPLCEGRLIPRAEPHVLIEWGHRTVALLVSLCLFGTALSVFTRRAVRARLGGLMGLALVLLVAQVLLGALTVWKLLSPAMVSSHLAVALLLFATMLTLALAAEHQADALDEVQAPATQPSPALTAAFAAATMLIYAQAVLGGVVSSTGAVAACPDWPTCQGQMLPPLTGLIGIQMWHRIGGYLAAAVVLGIAIAARRERLEVRLGARLAVTLVVAQVVLGVCAVLLQAPVWVSAMHLATGAALLAVLVITTFRLASVPAPAAQLIAAEAR